MRKFNNIIGFLSFLMIWFISCSKDDKGVNNQGSPSLSVSPADSIVMRVGDEEVFTAEIKYSDGSEIIPKSVEWTLEGDDIGEIPDDTVASISFVAEAEGKAVLTASSQNLVKKTIIVVYWNVDSVAIIPDSASCIVGDSVTYSARGWDSFGTEYNLKLAKWLLSGPNVGSLVYSLNDTAILSANDVGIIKLKLMYDTFFVERAIETLTPSPYCVYADTCGSGDIGAFSGGPDQITLVTDSTEYSEGVFSMRVDYNIRSIGWAGLFVDEGALGDYESRNMSHFMDGGHLRFDIKMYHNVEVGIRSKNITGGDEKSKVLLSVYGIPADSAWHEVAIPLKDFAFLDTNLDFSKMSVFFVASVVGKFIGAAEGSYWIDNVRWTID